MAALILKRSGDQILGGFFDANLVPIQSLSNKKGGNSPKNNTELSKAPFEQQSPPDIVAQSETLESPPEFNDKKLTKLPSRDVSYASSSPPLSNVYIVEPPSPPVAVKCNSPLATVSPKSPLATTQQSVEKQGVDLQFPTMISSTSIGLYGRKKVAVADQKRKLYSSNPLRIVKKAKTNPSNTSSPQMIKVTKTKPCNDESEKTFVEKKYPGSTSQLVKVTKNKPFNGESEKTFVEKKSQTSSSQVAETAKKKLYQETEKTFVEENTIDIASNIEWKKMGDDVVMYLCRICKKEAPKYHLIATHVPTHFDQRPYVCKICGKGFKVRRYLQEHIRGRHESRKYKCMYCQRNFNWRASLNAHFEACTRNHVLSNKYLIETSTVPPPPSDFEEKEKEKEHADA